MRVGGVVEGFSTVGRVAVPQLRHHLGKLGQRRAHLRGSCVVRGVVRVLRGRSEHRARLRAK